MDMLGMFEIKENVASKLAVRQSELAAVKVDEHVQAFGCCGRVDGSYRCSSH